MKQFAVLLFLNCLATLCSSQPLTSSSIFAHNDYLQAVPFYDAYSKEVGFIEADLFLREGKLLVAHTTRELSNAQTLDSLYLMPLQRAITRNNGLVYPSQKKLTLMLDLKTDGEAILTVLLEKLKRYPALLNCATLTITVSGDMPPASLWNNYPEIIHFDGRPDIEYTSSQTKRIALISESFAKYANWNGKGVLTSDEKGRLSKVITKAHESGKPMRFWATPDFTNAWIKLTELKVDIINSDHVSEAANFVQEYNANSFQNKDFHNAYSSTRDFKADGTPKNIILMIGDGMDLAQMYSGYTANRGSLNLFNIKTIGLSVTYSSDSYITDSAAGATAMATGKKTRNRYIGVDSTTHSIPSIVEKLKEKNFKTGIISNGDVTDATPASFYAHQADRGMSEAIALDFLSGKTDVLIGGGIKSFANRKDGRNLMNELHKKGYSTVSDFEHIDTVRSQKVILIDDIAVRSKKEGRGDFLSRSLGKTITLIKGNPFFIMIESAQIDHGGHDNNTETVVREMLDFDETIGEAMRFIDSNQETLLIVTADHETGGLSLLNGNVSKGSVFGRFSSNDHSGIPVPVFAYGPGAENFSGVFQNTEIYDRILKVLKIK